jgi:hypothetical protein
LITYVNGVSIVLKPLQVLFVMCMTVRDRLPGGLCMLCVIEMLNANTVFAEHTLLAKRIVFKFCSFLLLYCTTSLLQTVSTLNSISYADIT